MHVYFIFVVHFFFFKQKTAYDMRISDWSSDVCSSDLYLPLRQVQHTRHVQVVRRNPFDAIGGVDDHRPDGANKDGPDSGRVRSEEHTSELQSLMRISYAVFCLKKKKIQKIV